MIENIDSIYVGITVIIEDAISPTEKINHKIISDTGYNLICAICSKTLAMLDGATYEKFSGGTVTWDGVYVLFDNTGSGIHDYNARFWIVIYADRQIATVTNGILTVADDEINMDSLINIST